MLQTCGMSTEAEAFADFVGRKMREIGIDVGELSRRVGIERGTASRHLNRHNFPHYQTRSRYARAFSMAPDDFERQWRSEAGLVPAFDSNFEPVPKREEPPMPFFEGPFARGGVFVALPEPIDFGSADGMFGRIVTAGRFAVRVFGDSMEPDYPSGTVVEFRRVSADGGGMLTPGRDYLVCNSDNEGTFKTFVGITDDAYVFRARNREHYPKDLVVPRDMVVLMAVAECKREAVAPMQL